MKKTFPVVAIALTLCFTVHSSVAGEASNTSLVLPKIDRWPAAADFSEFRGKPDKPPRFNPDSNDPFQMDLRSLDLSNLDLRESVRDLPYATFDTHTQWPALDRQPPDFNPVSIMKLGRNPGLGIRSLHARGITGRGVSIAIVDQPLIVEHEEFGNRIRLYEEINIEPGIEAQMHGPAVASIAAGKTVGVAPEADIYFIAAFAFDTTARVRTEKRERNFRWYAQAVRRVLDINRQLPAGKKIRALSLSIGWDESEAGYEEMEQAVKAAKDAGMLVTSSSFSQLYGRNINGLGRAPLSDPDRFDSYTPGMFWAKSLQNPRLPKNALLIPMDSRTTAAPSGAKDYVFYRQGGWSWITPYLAGVYALAAQARPDITPDEFLSVAFQTAKPMDWKTAEGPVPLGRILDPVALIEALTTK